MDFMPTEEHELLIKSLNELLNRVAPESEIARLDNAHEFPWEMWRKVCDAGFGGLGIPEEYGGTPADTVTLCMVEEELNRHGFESPFGLNYMALGNICQFGSDKQRAELLPGLLKGEVFVALGISEPGAGSDDSAITTTYRKVDGGYLINGEKIFTTGAHIASHVMLVTRDFAVPDPYHGMTTFMVPMNTPGVRFEVMQKVGSWTFETCRTFYNNVFVPEDVLFGTEHNGFFQLVKNFERERLICCAAAVGVADAAFEDACRYANKREQFGQPIGKFQLIQEKIANMAIKVENMRNITYKTAWKIDQGIPVRIESAMAKLYTCQSVFEVCDDAMQIFGGVGYMMDSRIQRLWRNCRLLRIGAGTDQMMIKSVAPQILKQYREKVPEKA